MDRIYRFGCFEEAENATFFWDMQVHAVHLTIAVASIIAIPSFRASRTYRRLSKILQQPLSITDPIEKYKISHIYGRLSVDANSTSTDSLLGMKSPIQGSLGLYRQVEVLSKQNNWLQTKTKHNFKYQNEPLTSMTDYLPYGRFISSKIESKVFMNPSIRLQNLKVDHDLLTQMLQLVSNATRLPIDPILIESNFQKLKENPYRADSTVDFQKIHEAMSNLKDHPFSEAIETLTTKSSISQTKKQMIVDYDQHYIYLRAEKGQESTGDIRISFHDFGVLTDVTILGHNNGDTIGKYYWEYAKLQRASMIKVERNGKIEYMNAEEIQFIEKGILEKAEMVEHVMKSFLYGRSYEKTFACIVAIIALYVYLDDQMFYTLQEENEMERQIVRMNPETNEIEINHRSQEEYIPRNIFSAGVHLCALVFFSFPISDIGFALSLLVLYQNYRFYSDHLQVLEQIKSQIGSLKSETEGNGFPVIQNYSSFSSIIQKHFRLE